MIPERLTPTAEQLAKCEERLFPAFIDYTQNVSPRWMAISLRTSAYILWLTATLKPMSVVDWGSGFTSYVLRSSCGTVYTVDDSKEWLEKTRRFLKRYRCNTERLELADDYRQTSHEHQLVVYDFSSGEIRDGLYDFAISEIGPGGVGIMDDAAHDSHAAHMTLAAKTHGHDIWKLEEWTTDELMRYAALVA